jgi:hypothetical protein
MALAAAGCEVQLMALSGHPAMLTSAVKERFSYRPLNPIASVAAAIEQSQPDTVVPVDELAMMHLIELRRSGKGESLDALATRSLGGAEVLAAAMSRITLLELAKVEGVAVPETIAVASRAELDEAARLLGFPLVLKADTTAGGRGVRMANNLGEARGWWSRLHRPLSLPRSVWRTLKWREWTHFRPWFKRQMRGVSVQNYLNGAERTSMAVAHQGELRAFVCFEVAQASKFCGPSTVLRMVDDPVMEAAMRAVLRRMGATGFCGFDFMLNAEGEPLLIEMTSRPTQLAHLPLGPGKDLVAAYVRWVLGQETLDRASAAAGSLIALYPQELLRDAESALIAGAYHDVPWESPALVRYALPELPKVIKNDARWKGNGASA